jgi:hypothetical protein
VKKTKRKDHYIPQGYLRGFIDPTRVGLPKPLWCLDISTDTWSPRSTSEVGHFRGFYDYVGAKAAVAELEPADNAFVRLENDYPGVRDEIVSSGFALWTKHREFLLSFMRMMGVRSPLFREQKVAEGKMIRALVVEEINHERNTIKVKSLTPSPVSPAFIRNRAITQMREEIEKGAAWLKDFHWALRFHRFGRRTIHHFRTTVRGRRAARRFKRCPRAPGHAASFPALLASLLIRKPEKIRHRHRQV